MKSRVLTTLRPGLLAGALAFAAFTSTSHGATLTMNAIQDTTVLDEAFFRDTIYGGSEVLGIASYSSVGMILRFDTTNLASLAGATINSVSFTFTVASNAATTPSNAPNLIINQLSAANSAWTEGTSAGGDVNAVGGANREFLNKTGPGQPGTGTDWASGGNLISFNTPFAAADVAASYDAGSFADITFSDGDVHEFSLNGSDSAAFIAGWLGDSDLADAGVIVNVASGGTFFGGRDGISFNYAFDSVQAASGAAFITVDYTAIPEPSIYALIASAGVLVLVVRRRVKQA
ncbi:PEP-CTERM sorting domain-containing protein [Rubellicoccus peritrichatus]|uniref:PEP-CTERM sorting domain-containing protein n=1 Tax=Rubellicoccus peritrichatus TaxID=3080537 RepID=A0AAQ3L5D2_9BACT|nr:PEP-CTERM sorting domain-containing protein [Puniceicoccus sp. CR14]WOO39719.1 PEP-CTERM sorting domain-containing protein [Puniceicoccus sp. CR14]